VRTTIESDLPYEVEYLKAYDAFTTRNSPSDPEADNRDLAPP
jgi:hypothetical protein